MNELIREVMDLYHDEDSAHGHAQIEVQLAERLPPIKGDATQIRQVIHNLMQNAEDAAADESEPTITLMTRVATLKSSVGATLGGKLPGVELIVRDNGPGFAQKVMARAFEPYVTTKAKGTGLGLAIVKKIADDHDAKITLDNIVHAGDVSGARVTLTFPQVGVDSSRAQTQLVLHLPESDDGKPATNLPRAA